MWGAERPLWLWGQRELMEGVGERWAASQEL